MVRGIFRGTIYSLPVYTVAEGIVLSNLYDPGSRCRKNKARSNFLKRARYNDILFRNFSSDHVQRTARLEPFYLRFIIGMVEDDLILTSVLVVQHHFQGFAGSKGTEA